MVDESRPSLLAPGTCYEGSGSAALVEVDPDAPDRTPALTAGAGDIISWHGVSQQLKTEESVEARRGRGGREHAWRNYGTTRLPFGSDVDVPGGSWGVGGQPGGQAPGPGPLGAPEVPKSTCC